MKKTILIIGLFIIMSACTKNGTINISDPWVRQGKVNGNSAAYFTIINGADQTDKLLSAASSASENCELHFTQINAENKMMMMPQESVEVPSGETVEFKPGGYHVMMLNLKKDLQSGEKVKMTLQFEKAGKIEVEAIVKQ